MKHHFTDSVDLDLKKISSCISWNYLNKLFLTNIITKNYITLWDYTKLNLKDSSTMLILPFKTIKSLLKKTLFSMIIPEILCIDYLTPVFLDKWLMVISNISLNSHGCSKTMILIIMDKLMMTKCIKDKENNYKWFNLIKKNIEIMKKLKIGWEDIKISK